jgi:hypothetical protein
MGLSMGKLLVFHGNVWYPSSNDLRCGATGPTQRHWLQLRELKVPSLFLSSWMKVSRNSSRQTQNINWSRKNRKNTGDCRCHNFLGVRPPTSTNYE